MAFDRFLARITGLNFEEGEGEEAPPPVKHLEELSLSGVADYIKKIWSSEDKCKIIVMTGAGISTAAGIPDFRSPGTGLYDNLQKYDLPTPQAIFEIGYFRVNPKPFCMLAKELYPTKFKPTLSHYFIRVLAEEGLLLRNYTQNIDTLERRAGIHCDLLVEAHGAFEPAHCTTCGKEYSVEFFKDLVFRDEVPMCNEPGCAVIPPEGSGEPYKGLIKPDIVFFGESLPLRFSTCLPKDMKECKLLIIMGTSLKVQPFASLIDRVPDDCPRLLLNLEKAAEADAFMRYMGQGMEFEGEEAYRDVFVQGTCDEGCLQLARLLGLEEKLKQLHASEHEKLDKEIAEFEAAHPKLETTAVEGDKVEPKTADGDKDQTKTADGDKDEPKTVDGDKVEPKTVDGDKDETKAVDGDKVEPKAVDSDKDEPKAVESDKGKPTEEKQTDCKGEGETVAIQKEVELELGDVD